MHTAGLCIRVTLPQARSTATKRVQAPNITGTVPLAYSVYSDLECLAGPSSFTCSSASRGDTYKLAVTPLVAGSQWGSISFVTEDGQYCWYSLEVCERCSAVAPAAAVTASMITNL
jgi:hypothetical protein